MEVIKLSFSCEIMETTARERADLLSFYEGLYDLVTASYTYQSDVEMNKNPEIISARNREQ